MPNAWPWLKQKPPLWAARTSPGGTGCSPGRGIGRTREAARAHVAEGMEGLYRIPFDRFERFSPYGSPADVADFLRPYVAAGCRTFNISAQAASWEESVDAVGEIRALLNA